MSYKKSVCLPNYFTSHFTYCLGKVTYRSSEAVLSEFRCLMEVFLAFDAFSSHYETCGRPNMNTMQLRSCSLHLGCGGSFQKNVSNKEHNLKEYVNSSKEKKS